MAARDARCPRRVPKSTTAVLATMRAWISTSAWPVAKAINLVGTSARARIRWEPIALERSSCASFAKFVRSRVSILPAFVPENRSSSVRTSPHFMARPCRGNPSRGPSRAIHWGLGQRTPPAVRSPKCSDCAWARISSSSTSTSAKRA